MKLSVVLVDQASKNMEEHPVLQVDEILLGGDVYMDSSEDEKITSSKNILELLDRSEEEELCNIVSKVGKWYERSKLHVIKENQVKRDYNGREEYSLFKMFFSDFFIECVQT